MCLKIFIKYIIKICFSYKVAHFYVSDTGCEMIKESIPLQSALTAAVQTSVGVTEISLSSNTSNKTLNKEQIAQL